MKISKYISIIFCSIILMTACNISDHAEKLQKTDNLQQGKICKENIVIDGREYKYIEYEIMSLNSIRLNYIISEGDELFIPSKIDDYNVEEIGKIPTEEKDAYTVITKNKQKEIKKAVLCEGIKKINENSFYEMDIQKVILPETLKEISRNAFSGSTIKAINLENVEYIGWGAFWGCEKLRKVNLQNENVVIDTYAFSYAKNLTEIYLPAVMKGKLGDGCFSETSIKSITWPIFPQSYNMTQMGEMIFKNCNKLGSVKFQEETEFIYLNTNMFAGCKKLKKLVFPSKIKNVTYKSSPCADNYTENVTTLEFKGKRTVLEGCQDKEGQNFITVNCIIAPKGSSATEFAKKALRIKTFTKTGLEEMKTVGLSGNYANETSRILKKGTVTIVEY